MAYTPKTEEQLAKEGLLQDDEYDFEVSEALDKESKAGNEMTVLKLRVFGNDGTVQHITDYIVSGSNYGERKFRNAASACGLIDIYESGKLVASDFNNKCGRAKIKIQEGNADYPLPKNVVAEYVKKAEDVAKAKAPKPMSKDVLDDEVPF